MFADPDDNDNQPSNTPFDKGAIHPLFKNESEDLIWDRFRAGSEMALTYIYRNYSNQLFNYGAQFTKDRVLLKDCIQDLFVELINRRGKLSPTSSIKFYLMKALRNRLVKAIQKDTKRRRVEANSIEEGFQVTISAETRLINSQMDQAKRRILENKLNQLPALQREALVLYFYEGLKYQQIAEMLGIKTKSSRELVYRAIHSLEKLLEPHKDSMVSIIGVIGVMKSIM